MQVQMLSCEILINQVPFVPMSKVLELNIRGVLLLIESEQHCVFKFKTNTMPCKLERYIRNNILPCKFSDFLPL